MTEGAQTAELGAKMIVEQGTMTSPTLNKMLRAAVAEAFPELDVAGCNKVEILTTVMAAHGWVSIIELGRKARTLTWHPVMQALIALAEPQTLIERWIHLERFGHSRNRTEFIRAAMDGSDTMITLRHVALDAKPIVTVNDLFIWGILIGLLEAAGVTKIAAAFARSGAPPFVFFGKRAHGVHDTLPMQTDTITLRGRPTKRLTWDNNTCDNTGLNLRELFRSDLLRSWTVGGAARSLALSGRTLQRTLHAEGTTFSESLQRTRAEAANMLLDNEQLSLTEIGFCTGFSDQAHFTRVFRKFYDVPPSALRELLLSSEVSAPRGGRS